jgi:hypothetical protein
MMALEYYLFNDADNLLTLYGLECRGMTELEWLWEGIVVTFHGAIPEYVWRD